MLKLGTQSISALYLGGREIKKVYLGENLVFGSAPVQTYTITATIDPSGSGTVTGAGQYPEGATVTLMASAGDGYKFSGWQEGGQTVSTDNPYTFTAARDRALTAVLSEITSRLPDGYTEVEYIAGNGGYIDLGVSASNDIQILMDVSSANPGNTTFFGLFKRTGTSSSNYRFTQYNFQFMSTNAQLVYSINSTTTATTTAAKIGGGATADRTTINVDVYNRKLTVGESQSDMAYPGSTTETLYLFASHRILSSNHDANDISRFNLYSCKIKKSGEAIRDFIPCISLDGIAGLYDTVEDKFYGHGSFLPGPAI